MKTLSIALLLIAAHFAAAQLLPHYDRPGTGGNTAASWVQSSGGHGSISDDYSPMQPQMRAEERMGVTAKQMFGDGSGTMVSMQSRPYATNTFGMVTGAYYMMQAGAYVVPVFAQARHNFWSQRGEGIYGAAYGYAAGGPAVGIGQSLFAPTLSAFFQSLSFRVGAGVMTGLGMEFGGSAFGWSIFTEAGAMGLAFTAPLGPHRTYAAPFLAFGIRRAVGN